VDVVHAGGRVDGGAIRFAPVPWHRTVPATGQKDELPGNPLELTLAEDGRLHGVFGGEDGMSFTLSRREK
jgi:hypothetical protein